MIKEHSRKLINMTSGEIMMHFRDSFAKKVAEQKKINEEKYEKSMMKIID